MTESRDLRERLLSGIPVDPRLREHYEKELRGIIHMELRPAQRLCYGAMSLVLLAFAVVFAVAAERMMELDAAVRLMVAAASVNCAVHCVRIGIIVYRGQFDRTKSAKWRIGAVYMAVIFALWLVYAMRDRTGTAMLMFLPILAGMVLLCTGWIAYLIAQTEIRNREEMLEMKLHLAAITRQLGEKDRS